MPESKFKQFEGKKIKKIEWEMHTCIFLNINCPQFSAFSQWNSIFTMQF